MYFFLFFNIPYFNVFLQDLLKCKFESLFPDAKEKEVLKGISSVFKMKLIDSGERTYRLEGGDCQNTSE